MGSPMSNSREWGRRRIRDTLCSAALALGATTWFAGVGAKAAHAAAADIYNLGAFDARRSDGYAINDAGQVTGFSSHGESLGYRAFRYDGIPGAGGVMRDLGTLGGTYTDRSGGGGINEAGQVAGTSGTVLPSGGHRAFLYTGTPGSGGAMIDLGTPGGTNSNSGAINNAGQVAGSYDTGGAGGPAFHAFRYTPTAGAGGVVVDLGTLGGSQSFGNAINDAGHVAGSSDTAGGLRRAFLYTGTPGSGCAMVDLGTLPGGSSSGVSAINNPGRMAGDSYVGGDLAYHAFRYDGHPGSGGTMVDLGTLGGTYSGSRDINDAGVVVGFADRPAAAGGGAYAALWQTDAANTVIDLDAWLDATNPAQGAYWTLNLAAGINNHGLITGEGYYDDGPGGLSDGNRAFILNASSLVPEPGGLALIALGLPALLRRRAP